MHLPPPATDGLKRLHRFLLVSRYYDPSTDGAAWCEHIIEVSAMTAIPYKRTEKPRVKGLKNSERLKMMPTVMKTLAISQCRQELSSLTRFSITRNTAITSTTVCMVFLSFVQSSCTYLKSLQAFSSIFRDVYPAQVLRQLYWLRN